MSYQDDENFKPELEEEEEEDLEDGEDLLDPLEDDSLDAIADDEEGFEEEFAADDTE